MLRPHSALVSALILVVWGAAPIYAQGDETVAEPSPVESANETVIGPPSSGGGELRDALAQAVVERNAMTSQRDSLLEQRWLIIAYAALTSLLALWFMHLFLQRARSRTASPVSTTRGVDPGSLPTTSVKRKPTNATITIRNGATQQPEIVDRVATRRFFRPRPPTAPVIPVPVIAPAVDRARSSPPAPLANEYAPTEASAAAPLRRATAAPTIAGHVIPEPEAEPETTHVRIARRDGEQLARRGMSLLEVMIALAVLATVLSSVGGGIFVLSSAKRAAAEENAIHDLLRSWSERLIGAEWEWLGRDHLDDPLRGAWSWQRPETTTALAKGDRPPLREHVGELVDDATRQLLGDRQSGVQDLRCHLEYYRPMAVELCFAPPDGNAAQVLWDEVRPAYRLTPPIDLRQHLDAVVVRLSASWRAHDGGSRRQDLVFVRTR